MSVSRRHWLKTVSAAPGFWLTRQWTAPGREAQTGSVEPSLIRVRQTDANFEREPLIRPFGFKGGFLSELWQTAARIQSDSGLSRVGLCTQNVLYADAEVFAKHTESGGNALMYTLTDFALQQLRQIPFRTPTELLDTLLPQVYEEGKRLTHQPSLNKLFALNALIGVDNAAWLLYAAENQLSTFDVLIPAAYKPAMAHHNEKIAVMYSISYGLPMETVRKAVEQEGYFVIKIKLGQPGTQADMLEKDKARLNQIHQTIREVRSRQTANGKLIYTLDPNGRYERKETLLRLLDYARTIGALDQIVLIEEPFPDANEESVADVGVRLAADESAHDVEGVARRLAQGYGALVLKGIAKTLSMTLKKAQFAFEKGIPCLCADLTVNPILVDWNKNVAARLSPFPGIGMGLLETNGDLNYRNWQTMIGYHPHGRAPWTVIKDGAFSLDAAYYANSGGIFTPSPHYQSLFKQ